MSKVCSLGTKPAGWTQRKMDAMILGQIAGPGFAFSSESFSFSLSLTRRHRHAEARFSSFLIYSKSI